MVDRAKFQLTWIPIRDWNRFDLEQSVGGLRVPTNLNPYQGLKLTESALLPGIGLVPTNLNPYQGLKHSFNLISNQKPVLSSN